VIPQNEVIVFFGFAERSFVAIGIESGPPTIATCMSREANSLQIVRSVDSGMILPICAAPGAIVM
jgi:hypothetical protein